MSLCIDTLVELLVNSALKDKTEPDPLNLKRGWCTDLLLQAVDSLVVIRYDDPMAFAEIAYRALVRINDLPETEALLHIAIFRGKRLLPLDQEFEQKLVQLAEKLEQLVSNLPDGTRKTRCTSLLTYHSGIFFDACGRFDLAAQLQSRSEQEAIRLGDKPGAAIARFCEASSLLKDALKEGKPDIRIRNLFTGLHQAFLQLSKALAGTALQVQWAEGNAPAQMIESYVWLDQTHVSWGAMWNEWLSTALKAADKLGKAFRPGADFIWALNMVRQNDPKAEETLRAIADSDDINERRATALLVLARRLKAKGKLAEAKQAIEEMPREGTQHVYAIGQRMLAS